MISTPASGIVRSNPDFACHECGKSLVPMHIWGEPVQLRCVNRACAQCALPAAKLNMNHDVTFAAAAARFNVQSNWSRT